MYDNLKYQFFFKIPKKNLRMLMLDLLTNYAPHPLPDFLI